LSALLEQLGEAVATLELGLGHGVELRAEGGEGLELTELLQVGLERADSGLHGLDLGRTEPTRDTEMPTSMAGRTPDLNRSSCRKIWPSVIEITLVGM
jgi:hypothetical protein